MPARCPRSPTSTATATPRSIVEGGILDGATGALKHAFAPSLDGTLRRQRHRRRRAARHRHLEPGLPRRRDALRRHDRAGGNWPAIGDFDKDGKPEIVARRQRHAHRLVLALRRDAAAASSPWVRAGRGHQRRLRHEPLPGRQRGLHAPAAGRPPWPTSTATARRTSASPAASATSSSTAASSSTPTVTGAAHHPLDRDDDGLLVGRHRQLESSTSTATARPRSVYSDEEHLRIYDGTDGQRGLHDLQHDRHARSSTRSSPTSTTTATPTSSSSPTPTRAATPSTSATTARTSRSPACASSAIANAHLGAHARHLERARLPRHQRERRRHHPRSTSSPNWTQPGLEQLPPEQAARQRVRRARRGRLHRPALPGHAVRARGHGAQHRAGRAPRRRASSASTRAPRPRHEARARDDDASSLYPAESETLVARRCRTRDQALTSGDDPRLRRRRRRTAPPPGLARVPDGQQHLQPRLRGVPDDAVRGAARGVRAPLRAQSRGSTPIDGTNTTL